MLNTGGTKMAVISFVFDRILAERIGKIPNKVNVNHGFNIEDIEKIDLTSLGDKRPALKINFNFNVVYEPNIGQINMKGNVTYIEKEEEIKKLESQWKKEKKLPASVTQEVANAILFRANIKAL